MFTVSPMFSSHMVLQRDESILIWGAGVEDVEVIILFKTKQYMCKIKNNKWCIDLGIHEAGGPYDLTIHCGNQTIIFNDVLIGEVWLAGGQSNMEQPLFFSKEWSNEKNVCDNPMIRLKTIPRRPFQDAQINGWHFEHTQSHDTKWELCTQHSAKHFSAIGYYFAKKLQRKMNVPIGIISCNWGGTTAQAWMSRDYLITNDKLKFLWDDYVTIEKQLDAIAYEKEFHAYQEDMLTFVKEKGNLDERVEALGLTRYMTSDDGPAPAPAPPYGYKHFQRPCGLYDNMVMQVIPYTIKGVIWYQGESNANGPHATLYEEIFTTLIQNWRDAWKKKDLPFVFVQLSSLGEKDDIDKGWPIVRQAQLEVSQKVNHTAMVISADYGEWNNIHPINKKPIGNRLAKSALSMVYNQEETYRVITYNHIEKQGNTIIISFNEKIKQISEELPSFQLCGEDKRFITAEATIMDHKITVHNDNISNPVGVSYGFSKNVQIALYNLNDLPVTPFKVFLEKQHIM